MEKPERKPIVKSTPEQLREKRAIRFLAVKMAKAKRAQLGK